MRFLSIDIEATGLREQDLILEFAMIPLDSANKTLEHSLAERYLIKCPSFEELKPNIDEWVQTHNKTLIEEAHLKGITLMEWKKSVEQYLLSAPVRKYFGKEKIVLFGKSMNAIDLPFMNRDLGWNWMRTFFSHRTMDFSAVCFTLMDQGILPAGSESGTKLMNFLGMGEVAHNALDDAINTAKMYFKCLELQKLSGV